MKISKAWIKQYRKDIALSLDFTFPDRWCNLMINPQAYQTLENINKYWHRDFSHRTHVWLRISKTIIKNYKILKLGQTTLTKDEL